MNYLMGEMLIYFLGIALLGVVVGWLFTRSSSKRNVEQAEARLNEQLQDVSQQLDQAQAKLDDAETKLEKEHSRELNNTSAFQKLQSELQLTQSQFKEREQQVVKLNHSFDEVSQQMQEAGIQLEKQHEKNQNLTSDFDLVKDRLSVFESDLDKIAQQSEFLRNAFEQARLDLAEKDRHLAELESAPSEELKMSTLDGTEPELAISRIARLQARVQELFDEVNSKDQEIEKLKGSTTIGEKRSFISNMSISQTDDLQQINGIGEVLEQRLNNLGITRFSDIASWDDGDIDRFDQMLDFHGRIRRENWVEQARRLSQRGGFSDNRGY